MQSEEMGGQSGVEDGDEPTSGGMQGAGGGGGGGGRHQRFF